MLHTMPTSAGTLTFSRRPNEAVYAALESEELDIWWTSRHVSCYGGRGRTGLALACIRMLLEDEQPEVALAAAREACGGPETEAQSTFVVDLHRALR